MTSSIIDSGTAGLNLTVLNFPLFQQTGYVAEAKAVQFFNPSAGSDVDNAGGSKVYTSGETYIPDGGMALEIVFKMPSSPPVTNSKRGFLLSSLNGNGGNLAGDVNLSYKGHFSIGICDSAGYPCEGSASGSNAYLIYLANGGSNSDCDSPSWSPTGGTLTGSSSSYAITYYGSAINDGKFHLLTLNLTYSRAAPTAVLYDVYLDGTALVTGLSRANVNYVSGGANDGAIPLTSFTIGGHNYVSQVGLNAIDSTGSFPGLIDQVQIYDHPLTGSAIAANATSYSLPSP